MYILVIDKIMKSKDIDLNELSESTRLSRTLLSDLENNKTNTTLETLDAIATALDVDIKQLFYTESEIDNMRKELEKIGNNISIDEILNMLISKEN